MLTVSRVEQTAEVSCTGFVDCGAAYIHTCKSESAWLSSVSESCLINAK